MKASTYSLKRLENNDWEIEVKGESYFNYMQVFSLNGDLVSSLTDINCSKFKVQVATGNYILVINGLSGTISHQIFCE